LRDYTCSGIPSLCIPPKDRFSGLLAAKRI
jgi:hypothetical protein